MYGCSCCLIRSSCGSCGPSANRHGILILRIYVHKEWNCTTNDKHCTTNDKHCTTNDEQCTTNDEHCTTNDEHCTTNNEHCTINDEHCTTNVEHCTSNNENLWSDSNNSTDDLTCKDPFGQTNVMRTLEPAATVNNALLLTSVRFRM